MYLEIAAVVVLTIVNGILAMSELAVVSSRRTRLRVLADQGMRGARSAIELAANPGRFLSTVQIGITLVGVLSGAFSGATLGMRLAAWLRSLGLSASVADTIGVGAVVMLITYLSLIIGELVPKQIALRDPERVAARVAPAMLLMSRVASPLVWLLDASGKVVLRLLGLRGGHDGRMTTEEVKTIIAEAESAGVLESEEREMIAGVMRFADRTARAVMTPRRDVEIIRLADDIADIKHQLHKTRRSRLPVQDGDDPDRIVGVIFVKDVVDAMAAGAGVDPRRYIVPAPIVSDKARALDVLRSIRSSTVPMALVFDEYGHFEGVISPRDVLEAITGDFRDESEAEPTFVARADGSWLVSGRMPIDEFIDKIGGPADREADYATVAGLVLATLKRLPEVGETFSVGGWSFEVVDVDDRRIDKLIVKRPP